MMKNPSESDDLSWMRRALALAQTVMYSTAPNPGWAASSCAMAACWARAPPSLPAARMPKCALRDAQARGESVAGATVYVTLEPCSHFGRTPPCVDALLAAAPARVVVAIGDPNPLVNGRLARLRRAGIAVTTGICREEALALNAGFISRMSRGLPWTWLKMATSLDGRSALHNGLSQWITGPGRAPTGICGARAVAWC